MCTEACLEDLNLRFFLGIHTSLHMTCLSYAEMCVICRDVKGFSKTATDISFPVFYYKTLVSLLLPLTGITASDSCNVKECCRRLFLANTLVIGLLAPDGSESGKELQSLRKVFCSEL